MARTLPHLAPNLHRVPSHRTDLPVEEDPVPEMILGGGIQIGVHRAVKGACFPGETAICLSDNQSTPIESIREGDFVESYNMASQARECRRVERIFHHVADHLLILTIGEKTLRATDNHPFYLPAVNRWVEAQSLREGDELQTLDGDTVKVDQIRREVGKFPVFNFEVESTHTYYAEGVLVHNCGGAHAVQEMGAAYSEARVFESAGVEATQGGRNFRYVTEGEIQPTIDTGLMRGGREGQTFYTNQEMRSASTVQERLALKDKPTHRVEVEILNKPNTNQGRVKELNGQPGKGFEIYTEDPVKVKVINVQKLKP